jgi:hypothetical protein
MKFNSMTKKELVELLEAIEDIEGENYLQEILETIKPSVCSITEIDKQDVNRLKYLAKHGLRPEEAEMRKILNKYEVPQLKALCKLINAYEGKQEKEDIIEDAVYWTIEMNIQRRVISEL